MVKRRLIGGVILCLALTTVIAVEPPTTAIIGTPPQPAWSQLNSQQKNTLAPLAKDWDTMDNIHRKKWLGIAERYPTMKPDEQQRMQDRMREWADLTPEQRAKVRSSYKDFNQLPPEQKQVVKDQRNIEKAEYREEKALGLTNDSEAKQDYILHVVFPTNRAAVEWLQSHGLDVSKRMFPADRFMEAITG